MQMHPFHDTYRKPALIESMSRGTCPPLLFLRPPLHFFMVNLETSVSAVCIASPFLFRAPHLKRPLLLEGAESFPCLILDHSRGFFSPFCPRYPLVRGTPLSFVPAEPSPFVPENVSGSPFRVINVAFVNSVSFTLGLSPDPFQTFLFIPVDRHGITDPVRFVSSSPSFANRHF